MRRATKLWGTSAAALLAAGGVTAAVLASRAHETAIGATNLTALSGPALTGSDPAAMGNS
jgi:hypothetical protein